MPAFQNRRWGLLLVCSFVLWPLSSARQARAVEADANLTPLDAYVAKPDPSYSWKVVHTVPGDGFTTYVVDLKSQTWRAPNEVDRTLWEHWLIVVKPDRVNDKTAFLMIGGGSNRGDAPRGPNAMTAQMAVRSGTVAAELKMVPNQPLVFHNDGQRRTEDDLIAYTWVQAMKTADPTWTARMPMVKSAVRAMDTIQALLGTPEAGGVEIENFVVAGGSKRGWTTWLTGAVDPRVKAIVPAVIDVLNVRVSMQHHHDAYGFWAPAVGDYVHHKITDMTDAPEYAALLKYEDPYNYRARLTLPKYIVNAAGDEFFLPDSSQFYFDDLPGEKYLRYVPNAKHSLEGSDAIEGILAFYQSVLSGKPRPRFSWKFDDGGAIRVTAQDKPKTVRLWQATNPAARDFRLDTIGPAYTSTDLEASGSGEYVGRVEKPAEGWTAYFVELAYDAGYHHPLKFTTGVRVIPEVLPHKGKPLSEGK